MLGIGGLSCGTHNGHGTMPKKKKGGKKKKGKKDAGADDAGADPAELARRQMAKEAKRLFDQTKAEEEKFNEYQQQREKLNYFWIVEKKKLDDKKAELRNKERELQDLEEKHAVEIKVYKQRLKHLTCLLERYGTWVAPT